MFKASYQEEYLQWNSDIEILKLYNTIEEIHSGFTQMKYILGNSFMFSFIDQNIFTILDIIWRQEIRSYTGIRNR